MKTAIVTFKNGNTITTSINGTDSEIQDYYKIGSYFNLGRHDYDIQQVVSVEILTN